MRRVVAVVLAVVLTLLAACGIEVDKSEDAHGATGTAAPDLDSVTPLDDVRDWKGPATAVAADPAVHPVADNPEQKLPVTVTDNQGTKVTVKDTSRVLALDVYGSLSRITYELGLGDTLIGRDVSTQFEEAQDLPLVTHGGHDLSAESILDLDPTLIITDTSLGPWDVILQMREAGIPVVVVDSTRSIDNVSSLIDEVATALGVPAEGKVLAERSQAQIDDVLAKIAKVAPQQESGQLRTIFLYVRGQANTYQLFGEGSGADTLIEALGLYDVAKEINWKGSRSVTAEALIEAQPDLVLLMSKGLESVGGVDGLLEKVPALASTPAGENQRVVDMSDSQILGYGPMTAQVLNALAVAIYAPGSLT
ncbi:heme/hemin ABC transporter substrate-binding protein [Nocardioides alcanivorans]|uniref:heme/hemin ABC transporter substrate-binding protein n=1 Tax=Nocardioides alcanivorans TaxID=2897352 RepID=UPI001F452D7F|nr:ABC transporter substrate-binding protein [Nocardioides alcanivorans]